jgi:phage shock protein PspC (stress-responsive transcriptional regulator)
MKKVINASVGGREFAFDEDAYNRLLVYSRHFKARLNMDSQSAEEVMSDIERRLAELFTQATGGQSNRVIDYEIVSRTVEQLGMPDGSSEPIEGIGGSGGENNGSDGASETHSSGPDVSYFGVPGKRKLFRDKDHRAISGVCAGLAAYFDVDTTIVRVITLIACLLWGTGIVIYIVLMIVVPAARTPLEKCQMYGLEPTAENLAKFSNSRNVNEQKK